MFRIVIPIFFRTEEMKEAPEDVYFKFTEYDVKDVIFYDISALSLYVEDDKVYTVIHTPGSNFYSPTKRSEIDKMIIKAKSQFLLQ